MKKKKILTSVLAAIITGIALLSMIVVGSIVVESLPKQVGFILAVFFLMAALAYFFYKEISKPKENDEPEYLEENEIPMRARKISEISCWEAWESSTLYSAFDQLNPRDMIFIDAEGYKCSDRNDFVFARDNNRFPVTVYRFMRTADIKSENKEV